MGKTLEHILITIFAVVAISDSLNGENLHIERLFTSGKGQPEIRVPRIFQTDIGLAVEVGGTSFPGPTYFDLWREYDSEVPFPLIAINAMGDITGEYEEDDDLVYSGNGEPFAYEESVLAHYEFSKNASWVESLFVGTIQIEHYPWIYSPELGWNYILQSETYLRGMSFWLYNWSEKQWMFVSEKAMNWIYDSNAAFWSEFGGGASDDHPIEPPPSPPRFAPSHPGSLLIGPFNSSTPISTGDQALVPQELEIVSAGPSTATIKWYKNGAIIENDGQAKLSIDALSHSPDDQYQASITHDGQTIVSSIFGARSDTEMGGSSEFINLSTRGYVGTEPEVLIGGFVVYGNKVKKVLIQAVGQELESVIDSSLLLQDPVLEIWSDTGKIAENDDWRLENVLQMLPVGSTPLDQGSKSAAIIIDLLPGLYTAIVRGADGSEGIVLLEMYCMER